MWLGCQDIGYQVCMAGDGLDLGGVEIHRGIWSPGTVLTSSVGGLKEREMGRERLGNLGDASTTSEWDNHLWGPEGQSDKEADSGARKCSCLPAGLAAIVCARALAGMGRGRELRAC